MNTTDRLQEAHRIVDAAAPVLALGNALASGYTFLARVALNAAAKRLPADDVADWAEQFAAGLRRSQI